MKLYRYSAFLSTIDSPYAKITYHTGIVNEEPNESLAQNILLLLLKNLFIKKPKGFSEQEVFNFLKTRSVDFKIVCIPNDDDWTEGIPKTYLYKAQHYQIQITFYLENLTILSDPAQDLTHPVFAIRECAKKILETNEYSL